MAGPQDRDPGASSGKKFDVVWGELLGDDPGAPTPAAAEVEPQAGPEQTKLWDDSARAPGPSAADAVDEDATSDMPAATRLGHAGTLAKEAQEAAAAREMQLLMEGAALEARLAPALRLVDGEPTTTTTTTTPTDADTDADAATDSASDSDSDSDSGARPDAARIDPPRDPPANKTLLALVGMAIAVGVGWMILRDPAPARTPSALAKPPPAAPIEPEPGARPGPPPDRPAAPSRAIPAAHADDAGDPEPQDEEGSTGTADIAALGESGEAPPASVPPAEPAANLRDPPPGTPEAIAAAFRKLPVSAADRPPVGGIGESGIHVDRIWMGSRFEDGDCTGSTDRFSVSADPRPSVCIRVVHPREKEDVVVVWEKSGGSARRSKVSIKPTHAYRTRAYLLLRREYVGSWTVRILSADGVELASHAFEVVE
jgi:hypothetical protein